MSHSAIDVHDEIKFKQEETDTALQISASDVVYLNEFKIKSDLEDDSLEVRQEPATDILEQPNCELYVEPRISITSTIVNEESNSKTEMRSVVSLEPSTYSHIKCKYKRVVSREFRNFTLLQCPGCDKTLKGGVRRMPCMLKHIQDRHPKQRHRLASLLSTRGTHMV